MSTAGLSEERLGRMHERMAGYVERGEVPGIVTLVSRRGEVHVDAIGLKAIGSGDPIQRDTIFRISSMTKSSRSMTKTMRTARDGLRQRILWTTAMCALIRRIE